MIQKLLKALTTFLLISAIWQANAIEPMADKSIFAGGYPESAPVSSLELDFKALGVNNFKLDGVNNNIRVDFSNRMDMLNKNLVLNFSYTNSPSLLDHVSHLKVYFNENLVTVLPINKELSVAENKVENKIRLNSKLIQGYNQIRFELVGYYNLTCHDYHNKSIWTEISKSSYITLEQTSLAIDSELEYLPAPFFDERDLNTLSLPFVFSKIPDNDALEAAATLASWFGAQANWRGADFPFVNNKAPDEHSVVFVTNTNKPDFLRDYPNVDKPTIEIISNPHNRYKKMLLILGKNNEDLKIAVKGLVFGYKVMTGRSASISNINEVPLREPYDAPRWLRSDRPVAFNELTEYPNQLQSQGLRSGPVTLNVRFAPDLFIWRQQGIPIDLKYRNTPESASLDSRLNMLINQQFISGFLLNNDDSLLNEATAVMPLLSNTETTKSAEGVSLSGINLAQRNQLNFDFRFGVIKEGLCAVEPAGGEYGIVDGESTIDVSDFSHYIALPDLNVFANSGFPFTKYADLQKTQLLIDEQPTAESITLLLNLVGHFGAITGYPGHMISIENLNTKQDYDDKDILIISNSRTQKSNLEDNTDSNILLQNSNRVIKQAIYNGTYDEETTQNVKVDIISQGELAAVAGFQSPFNSDRSVVSLTVSTNKAHYLLNDLFNDPQRLSQLKDSAAVITSQSVKTVKTDKQYYVGNVPIHTLIWFHLSDHPFMLALLSLITLLLISFIIWRLLQAFAYKRLAEGNQ